MVHTRPEWFHFIDQIINWLSIIFNKEKSGFCCWLKGWSQAVLVCLGAEPVSYRQTQLKLLFFFFPCLVCFCLEGNNWTGSLDYQQLSELIGCGIWLTVTLTLRLLHLFIYQNGEWCGGSDGSVFALTAPLRHLPNTFWGEWDTWDALNQSGSRI